MNEIFSRTAMLIGEENLEKLSAARAAVFGIGGVGGYAAEALVRAGVGALDFIDNDTVAASNINRQIIATAETIGRPKTEVMRERALLINPDIKVHIYNLFYLPETADMIDLGIYDYIIDAIDTVSAKLELITRAAKLGVPVISSMGAANKLNPAMFEVSDIYKTSVCPMARVMRHELKKRGITALKVVYSKEPPVKPRFEPADTNGSRRQTPASISFVPPAAGLILAGVVVEDLIAEARP